MTPAGDWGPPPAAPVQFASIDDLFAHDLAAVETESVPLGNGLSVHVRGLTRYELLMNGKGTDDVVLIEARNLATCMVDPVMTIDVAERWQRSTGPGVIAPVVNAIRRLSGLAQGAAKSGVPGDGVRGA